MNDRSRFDRRRLTLLRRPDMQETSRAEADECEARTESNPTAPPPRPSTARGRRPVANALYRRLRRGGESFWTSVYPLYMRREITRSDLRGVVERGLEDARGNYRIVVRLFNLPRDDYKRFLNFLRKHDCEVPFKNYR